MPVGPNGKKNLAIVEYTHEVAVPYALFILEGTELFGARLCLSSNNNNSPSFYVPKYEANCLPVPAPFDKFEPSRPPPQMMLNISNSSHHSEPNFDALLQMGQNMLIPPPIGFGGIPMNLPMSSPYDFNSNDHRNHSRHSHRDHDRDRNGYRDYDREERDHSRRSNSGGRHKHRRR